MSTKQDRKRIKEWVLNWQKTLFLNDYLIHIQFPDKDDDNVVGRTDVTVRYYEATIQFYPALFKEDLDIQWRCVAHEMTHILLAHIQQCVERLSQDKRVTFEEWKDVLEQATTRTSNIFVSAWPHK